MAEEEENLLTLLQVCKTVAGVDNNPTFSKLSEFSKSILIGTDGGGFAHKSKCIVHCGYDVEIYSRFSTPENTHMYWQ